MSLIGTRKLKLILLACLIFPTSCQTRTATDSGRIRADGQAMAELGRINQNMARGQYVLQSDIDSLDKIREKYPRAEPLRLTLIGALVRREDWQSVVDFIVQIPVAERTENEKRTLANVYLNIGRFEDAIAEAEPLLAKSPADADLVSIVAGAKFYLGRYDEAAADLDKIWDQLVSGRKATEIAVRGMIFFYRKDNERAVAALNKSVELNPDNIFAFNGLARVFAAMGDDRKAGEYLKKVQESFAKMTAESQRRYRFVESAKRLEEAYQAKRFDEVIALTANMLPDADEANKLALYQYRAAAYEALGKTQEYQSAAAEIERLKSANLQK